MPDELYRLIASEGIAFAFADLPVLLLGVYDFRQGNPSVILLHKDLKRNSRLLRCILAEELGHHFTTGFDIIACARTSKNNTTAKYENLAQWWATQYLVPLNRLKEAITSGVTTTYELAEYFDVTERFMGTSLRLYQEKKCLVLQGGD